MTQGATAKYGGRIPYIALAGPLIDQIPAAIALFDLELRCVLVNALWRKTFPCSSLDPVGAACDAIFPTGCPPRSSPDRTRHRHSRSRRSARFPRDN